MIWAHKGLYKPKNSSLVGRMYALFSMMIPSYFHEFKSTTDKTYGPEVIE